jgi:hypothetical protein
MGRTPVAAASPREKIVNGKLTFLHCAGSAGFQSVMHLPQSFTYIDQSATGIVNVFANPTEKEIKYAPKNFCYYSSCTRPFRVLAHSGSRCAFTALLALREKIGAACKLVNC